MKLPDPSTRRAPLPYKTTTTSDTKTSMHVCTTNPPTSLSLHHLLPLPPLQLWLTTALKVAGPWEWWSNLRQSLALSLSPSSSAGRGEYTNKSLLFNPPPPPPSLVQGVYDATSERRKSDRHILLCPLWQKTGKSFQLYMAQIFF